MHTSVTFVPECVQGVLGRRWEVDTGKVGTRKVTQASQKNDQATINEKNTAVCCACEW